MFYFYVIRFDEISILIKHCNWFSLESPVNHNTVNESE